MRRGGLFQHGFGLAVVGTLVPSLAYASLAECEAQAQAAFQKKSVATEFSVINGDLSEIEAADARAKLKNSLGQAKKSCELSAHAPRAKSDSGTL